jgi:hypothetical protein
MSWPGCGRSQGLEGSCGHKVFDHTWDLKPSDEGLPVGFWLVLPMSYQEVNMQSWDGGSHLYVFAVLSVATIMWRRETTLKTNVR